MPYDRSLIGPYETGLQKNVRPWLIMDDAFTTLQNCYVFRGRIRKRFGSQLMNNSDYNLSRFRIQLGTTDAMGDIHETIPFEMVGLNQVPYLRGAVGQTFSIEEVVFTVTGLGTPTNLLRTDGLVSLAQFDTSASSATAGNVDILNGPPLAILYWYPSLPVMGLDQYLAGDINDHPSFGFDTKFAYTWVSAALAWQRSANVNGAPVFHGDTDDFFWVGNYLAEDADLAAMFVTNFNVTIGLGSLTDDPMWIFDDTNSWRPFSYLPDLTLNPTNELPFTVTQTDSATHTIITSYVQSALIILPFKGSLLLLNTIENDANGADQRDPMAPSTTGITPTNYVTSTNFHFKQRCRYSGPVSPLAPSAWLDPNQSWQPAIGDPIVFASGGGAIDASTDEAIVSAEFIKDRLIVYFERSTWEIVFTGNLIKPFYWQKLNTELGAQSTFSIVPFDTAVLAVGNTGIHACNGSNVKRIDEKIPDDIFLLQIKNSSPKRIHGIRDYQTEMVYWTLVTDQLTGNQSFPNQVLVFNYKNSSWGYNDDTFTAFGYFEQSSDITWETAQFTWSVTGTTWTSGILQAQQRQILAGTPEGFILVVNPDETRNAPSMIITNMVNNAAIDGTMNLTIINHNCIVGQYIAIENLPAGTTLVNLDADGDPFFIVYILNVVSDDVIEVIQTFAGVYLGGATAARVSEINMVSKQWNPYVAKGSNVYLSKIDFCVVSTGRFGDKGQITVDYYPSSSNQSTLQDGGEPFGTDSLVCNGILETTPYNPVYYPLETYQARLWHPLYFQTQGEFIQINMYWTPVQMVDPDIVWEDFELEAINLYTSPTSNRLE